MRFVVRASRNITLALDNKGTYRAIGLSFLVAVLLFTQMPGWTDTVTVSLSHVLRATLKLIGAGKQASKIEKLLEGVTILRQTTRATKDRYEQIESLMRHAEALARRDPIPANVAQHELDFILQRQEELRNQLGRLEGVTNEAAVTQRASMHEQLDLLNESESLARIRSVTSKVSTNNQIDKALLKKERNRLEILLEHTSGAEQEELRKQLETVRNLQDIQSGFVATELNRGADAAVSRALRKMEGLHRELNELESSHAAQNVIAAKAREISQAERQWRLLQGEAQAWAADLYAPAQAL